MGHSEQVGIFRDLLSLLARHTSILIGHYDKWQILANLLPEYASLVTTLTNFDRDDDPLDIRDIKESCMREERIMNRRAAVPGVLTPPMRTLLRPFPFTKSITRTYQADQPLCR